MKNRDKYQLSGNEEVWRKTDNVEVTEVFLKTAKD